MMGPSVSDGATVTPETLNALPTILSRFISGARYPARHAEYQNHDET